MRIGCLQFAPQLGDIDNNLNRADAVLSKANPADLDLLVLPELAFTGFNFKSLQEITPFLEPKGSGITSLWVRTVALKYDCVVCAGYPEKVDVSQKWPTGPEYYNSAIVVNGDGETIGNYRKSFLYTDDTWALEGPKGFYADIIPGLGNTSIGICMDLNPYKFETPWSAFEFAYHVLDNYCNLVIVTMAWMTREDGRAYSRTPMDPDLETLTYWINRLEPLIRSDNKDEIIVVFCNRTGSESEATYAGTSAVLGILDGEVRVYGMLGRGEKNLLVVDTNNPPRAKMVYRPEGEEEANQASTDQAASREEMDRPTPRDQTGSPAPSTVKGASRQNPPKSPQPPAPPIPSVKHAKSERETSQTRREVRKTQRRDMTVKVSRPSQDDDTGVPTPSAPSPTPMAMRPKVIIPDSAKSPPVSAMDDFSEPASALSLRSQGSFMSNHSYASRASESTVRSFARAPEDSTPYPHSGISVDHAFSPGRKIYGGTVTFDPQTEYIKDGAQRSFWSPSPQSPEAFLWPPAKHLIMDREQDFDHMSAWDHVRKQESISRQELERRKAARKSDASLGSDRTSKFYAKSTPPGSRSTSRNQVKSAVSPIGIMDPTVAFVQHTAHLIPGPDAAERIRQLSGTDSPIPERPSSPKSRNASRSRPTGSPELQRSHSAAIQIFASRSVIGGNADAEGMDRGRPAEAKDLTMTTEKRSGSLPATGVFQPASEIGPTLVRPPTRQQSSRRPSQSHRRTSSASVADFERVEEIVHDACPVHGRASRSGSVADAQTTTSTTTATTRASSASTSRSPPRANPAPPETLAPS